MPQEKFDLYFLAMGQGDCTLIKCPDDQVVMIDCGSERGFTNNLVVSAKSILRNLIGFTNKIDTLILTHHDGDHCNQLGTLLFNALVPHIQIDTIYYSNPKKVSSEDLRKKFLKRYCIKDFIMQRYFGNPTVHEVVINSGNGFTNTWKAIHNYADNKAVNNPVNNKKITVASGKTLTGNKDWSISIIAGSVTHQSGSPSNDINAGSIVTLLEIDGHKALICGDATLDTEQFLLNHHDAAITDVKILQVPHHGSDTSSKQAFVNKTDPYVAVISVQFLEHHYRLPKKTIMQRWVDTVADGAANHALDSWRDDLTTFQPLSNTMQQTITNEQHLSDDQKTIFAAKNFWYYLDGTIGDYGVSYANWMINRTMYTDKVWQTSTLGQTDQLYIKLSLPL